MSEQEYKWIPVSIQLRFENGDVLGQFSKVPDNSSTRPVSAVQGGVWVKASERRPGATNDRKYICRNIDNKSQVQYCYWNQIPTYYEWLDESVSETPTQPADTNDPFVKKHLDTIFEKTKQSQIELHIKPMFGSLDAASIEYFLEKGTVNGGFAEALNKMMDGVRGWIKQPANNGTIELTREGAEIESLKNENERLKLEVHSLNNRIMNLQYPF